MTDVNKTFIFQGSNTSTVYIFVKYMYRVYTIYINNAFNKKIIKIPVPNMFKTYDI